MLRITKNYRIPKRPGVEKNSKVHEIFLKALDDFRRRMRRTKFTKVTPFINYLSVPSRRKDFMNFVNSLEEFRCNTVGMNENVFYKLVAEFILVPNGIKYYNPMHLFGCAGSFEAEEFRERIFETLVHISSRVGRNGADDDTYAFISRVNSLHNLVDLNDASPVFRQKDWFCIKSVQKIVEEKGWTVEETVGKIRIFYRNRIRKVYPEMLLMDFAHGELDSITFDPEKEKKKRPRSKPKHIFAIEQSEWYPDWKKGLKE